MKYKFQISINHNLYKGAYSGLCCGNVYRDKGEKDSINDRYNLGTSGFPIIHGHNYIVTVETNQEENPKYLSSFFKNYHGKTILTKDNPLVEALKDHNLIIWDKNPTAEVMAKKWYTELTKDTLGNIISVEVEETARNSVSYFGNNEYKIKTHLELPISREEDNKHLWGYNFYIDFMATTNSLNENGMVIDFKEFKKILHNHMDQYDHSMILSKNHPLVDLYKKNYKENKIDFKRSRLFVWDETPTNKTMGEYFAKEVFNDLKKIKNLKTVECLVKPGIDFENNSDNIYKESFIGKNFWND